MDKSVENAMATIDDSLRSRRKFLGVGVRKLARDSGLSEMTIRGVEGYAHTRRKPNSHTLSVYERLAQALGCRIEWHIIDTSTGEEVE